MTDEGYSPANLVIQPGQKVIWKNTGTVERWPASNNHPTHQNYPTEEKGCLGSQLDACQALASGESFDFTFNNSGSWGIHDHLSPGMTMVVEVADVGPGFVGQLQILWQRLFSGTGKSGRATPQEFASLNYGQQSDHLKELANDNPAAAWQLMKDAFIVNGEVINNVHEFSHVVGNASYRKSGVSGVGICDDAFAYGCFHGVAEAAITDLGQAAITDIETACTEQLGIQKASSCYHGIGHGTAGINGLQLKPALEACDQLKPSNRSSCYDGVFMEQADSLGKGTLNAANPWQLCSELAEKYYPTCAKYQPNRLRSLGYDSRQILAECDKAKSVILQEHCSKAVGYSIASSSIAIEEIHGLCGSAAKLRNSAYCVMGSAVELVFQDYKDGRAKSMQLCKSISYNDIATECTEHMNGIIRSQSQ